MGVNNLKRFLKYIPLILISLFLSCFPSKIAKPTNTPQVHIVEMLASQFEPSVVTVDSGDVVKWINRDLTAHQLVGFYGENWRSGVLGYGKSYSWSFQKTSSYACIIHPEMLGVVRVRWIINHKEVSIKSLFQHTINLAGWGYGEASQVDLIKGTAVSIIETHP